MKTYIPLDRLKRSRDSGSALYNMHPTDVLGRAGGGRLVVVENFYCGGGAVGVGGHHNVDAFEWVGGFGA